MPLKDVAGAYNGKGCTPFPCRNSPEGTEALLTSTTVIPYSCDGDIQAGSN